MTHAAATVLRWRREWAARYRGGATIREIAYAEGKSTKYVHEQLREAGVAMRPAQPRPGKRRA